VRNRVRGPAALEEALEVVELLRLLLSHARQLVDL
jgi:hypothetical protein